MSFSLVAGALCYVQFTNQVAAENSTNGYSLNINSTGAKYLRYCTKYNYATSQNTTLYNFNGTATSYIYDAIPVSPGPYFLIFNGTHYCSATDLATMYYSDYSDYSD